MTESEGNHESTERETLARMIEGFKSLHLRVSKEGSDEEFKSFEEAKNSIGKKVTEEFDLRTILRGSPSWHSFLSSSLPEDAPERLAPSEELRVLKKIALEIGNEFPALVYKQN